MSNEYANSYYLKAVSTETGKSAQHPNGHHAIQRRYNRYLYIPCLHKIQAMSHWHTCSLALQLTHQCTGIYKRGGRFPVDNLTQLSMKQQGESLQRVHNQLGKAEVCARASAAASDSALRSMAGGSLEGSMMSEDGPACGSAASPFGSKRNARSLRKPQCLLKLMSGHHPEEWESEPCGSDMQGLHCLTWQQLSLPTVDLTGRWPSGYSHEASILHGIHVMMLILTLRGGSGNKNLTLCTGACLQEERVRRPKTNERMSCCHFRPRQMAAAQSTFEMSACTANQTSMS